MTTLQQTQPPVLCYEIWEYNDEIRGSIIDWKPFWKAVKDFPVSFDLKGRSVHIILVTQCLYITREDAIHFAKAVAENRLKRANCDLTSCNPKRKK